MNNFSNVAQKHGVLTLSGYGVRVWVERGHLCIEDGIGDERRRERFARVPRAIKRLVILGHSGIISLEALRWLHDTEAAFVQIDNDGELIIAAGPSGLDDARLRRAQALASSNEVGLEIGRELLRKSWRAKRRYWSTFQRLRGHFSISRNWSRNCPTMILPMNSGAPRHKPQSSTGAHGLTFR